MCNMVLYMYVCICECVRTCMPVGVNFWVEDYSFSLQLLHITLLKWRMEIGKTKISPSHLLILLYHLQII